MNGPETRESLLFQIRDPSHRAAWEEFVAIYEPLVYRLARRNGFQHADATDLCQDVLTAVGKSIERFDPDPRKGSFRGWLFRISRNLMITRLTRDRNVQGSGDTAIQSLLEQHADDRSEDASQFDSEYRREVFRWAANRVKHNVNESTWRAFWLTAVDGESVANVARVLGKSQGAIRVARCRVFSRIRNEVKRFEDATPLE